MEDELKPVLKFIAALMVVLVLACLIVTGISYGWTYIKCIGRADFLTANGYPVTAWQLFCGCDPTQFSTKAKP